MPGKIKPVHHSLTDWDFQFGAQYRSLAVDHYVSPPSSLKFTGAPGGWTNAVLCRIADTLCLPQGEVRTWARRTFGIFYPCVFRNDRPLGSAGWVNSYYVYIAAARARLYLVYDSALYLRDETVCYWEHDEWIHYRVFWYNGKTPGDEDALCVDIYYEVAGEWVRTGATMYDTGNYFKDDPVNRCGIAGNLGLGHTEWFDNTEIWGPV